MSRSSNLADSSVLQTPAIANPAVGRQAPPRASFIVCTRNRAGALEACIKSIQIACQSHAVCPAELVVVDNGSTDDSLERVARLAERSNLAITIVYEARPGLSAARNAGLERACGQVLIFIDDDCEVHRNYLRDLDRHYATGEPCVRGGRVELGNSEDLPFTIKRLPTRERLERIMPPGGFVLGCNMTMTREVAIKVGRFDERFGVGGPLRSAEDTDYLVRAFLLGIPVEYVPDMTVFHHHGRGLRREVDALHRNYSFGNGGLYLKHIRHAPWLLRHFYWAMKSACRELVGGPPFDPELRLSHWPIVFMNLLGAAQYVRLSLTKPSRRSDVRQPQQATT